MRRMGTRATVVAAMAALLMVLVGAVMPATATAAPIYYNRPGDPMWHWNGTTWQGCTGGFVIRGASGTFQLSAGHCPIDNYSVSKTGVPVYRSVNGILRQIGTEQYTKWAEYDTELVRETPSFRAYQIVVDPHTGGTPGGSGKVVRYSPSQEAVPNSKLVPGYVVAKMGLTTGWTEGKIVKTRSRFPFTMTEYCTDAKAQGGDSGGPVWQNAPGGGVYAVGITVSADQGGACFASMADLLQLWGAHLPVWSSGAA